MALFIPVWQIPLKRFYIAESQISETGKWAGRHISLPATPLSQAATLSQAAK